MVMHSSDGTFCKTLDGGVELWVLDPHTEPCLSYAPSGSPAGPPVVVAAVKDGKIVGKVIYLPVPLLLDQDNALGAICMDLEILTGFRGLKLFRAMLDEGKKPAVTWVFKSFWDYLIKTRIYRLSSGVGSNCWASCLYG